METIKIEARMRTRTTKANIKQARRYGWVPAAVSGKGIEPFLVEVSSKSIADVLRSEGALSTLVELSVPGQQKKTVIIADLDRDPITRGFLHASFHNIGAGEKVHTQIPVHLIGVPTAVTQHQGMIDQMMETIEVRGDRGKLPTHIDVDISALSVGDKVHVSDLPKPSHYEYLSSEEAAIVSILAVKRIEEPAAKEAAPAAS